MTVLVVAETGLNHDGDVGRAHAMIDAAADAGADAAKFQCYRTSDFIADRALMYNRQSQAELFGRCELPDEAWPELRDHCRDRGVVFFATPTSEERLEFLVDLGVPMLKNGSDYLGHLPLIRAMAETGLPTILSTGMATRAEVEAALEAFFDGGGHDVTLLVCTSTYPTVPADVHLRRIPALADDYGLPTGFSDHTEGATAAIAAAALGACMVEKHFTLNRASAGPDHAFSADPPQLQWLVTCVRTVEAMLGDEEIRPTLSELESRRLFRVTLGDDGRYLRR